MRNYIDTVSGLLSEELRDNLPEYRKRLIAADFEVTEDQYVTHKHLVDVLVPLRKSLSEAAQWMNMNGITTNEDIGRLNDFMQMIDDLCVPLALLKVKEKKPGLRLPPRT